MPLIAGRTGATSGLTAEVVEDQNNRTHLVDEPLHPDALSTEAKELLLGVVRTYLRQVGRLASPYRRATRK